MHILYYKNYQEALLVIEPLLKQGLKIIFDIDDTLSYIKNKKMKRIPAIYDFYKKAVMLHCQIFFVTARPLTQKNRWLTKNLLKKLGYDSFEKLFLMPRTNTTIELSQFKKKVALFKFQVRKKIGYPIFCNIGNSWQDLLEPTLLLTQIVESKTNGVYLFSGVNENVDLCVKLPHKFEEIL